MNRDSNNNYNTMRLVWNNKLMSFFASSSPFIEIVALIVTYEILLFTFRHIKVNSNNFSGQRENRNWWKERREDNLSFIVWKMNLVFRISYIVVVLFFRVVKIDDIFHWNWFCSQHQTFCRQILWLIGMRKRGNSFHIFQLSFMWKKFLLRSFILTFMSVLK
jgi:hypothetical protein